ncbi:MAG: FxDxF family PEP-CTERM protein [Burkholderiales bacterium]
MSILKKLALAATLGVAFLGSARAADVGSVFLLTNSFADTIGTTEQYYAVSNVGIDVNGVPVPARSAGDAFVDDFLLQVFDDQTFSLFLNAAGVSFDSVQMYDLSGATYDFDSFFFSNGAVLGNGLSLQSGLYDLEVSGSVTADGGGYSGALANVVAVPEPEQWALMLMGLGALGLVNRRRAKSRR